MPIVIAGFDVLAGAGCSAVSNSSASRCWRYRDARATPCKTIRANPGPVPLAQCSGELAFRFIGSFGRIASFSLTCRRLTVVGRKLAPLYASGITRTTKRGFIAG